MVASRTSYGLRGIVACWGLTLATALGAAGCRTVSRQPAVATPGQTPTPEPSPTPTPTTEDLSVKKAEEEVVVAAWAEPSKLPAGGGQAQILVRAQKRGGAAFPGVEVRLRSSSGALFSAGRVLVTDSRGMTRDRLTAHRTAEITLNAGGTRYRFTVPVLLESAQ